MKKLLKPERVAGILDITKERFYALAREGIIPVVRLGKQIRVDEEELNLWIKEGGKSLYEIESSGILADNKEKTKNRG